MAMQQSGAIGPISYDTGADSPVKAFTDALQAGNAVQQMDMQQKQQALALQTQQQLAKDTAAVAANPTPQAIANLSIKYPQMGEQFKRSYDMLDSTQQKAKLDKAVPIYAAVNSGNNDVAAKLLKDQADSYDAAGRPSDAAQARTMATLVVNHPEAAKTTMGLLLSSAMGPEKFATTFGTVGDQQRASDKAPLENKKLGAEANIKTAEANVAPQTAALANKNVQSQIDERAARLGIDKDKLTSEMQVKLEEIKAKQGGPTFPGAATLINDGVAKAVMSDQTASHYNELAGKIEQAGMRGGIVGQGIEAVKAISGNQDEITALKKEYAKIRASGMATGMPGVTRMTDNDIKLVGQGFPDEKASPVQIASFLRGMAKLQMIDSATNSAKAEWANSVGHLGKPKTDINIQGITVPAGQTFPEFQRRFNQQLVGKLEQEEATKTVAGRSYMRHAAPDATQQPQQTIAP